MQAFLDLRGSSNCICNYVKVCAIIRSAVLFVYMFVFLAGTDAIWKDLI